MSWNNEEYLPELRVSNKNQLIKKFREEAQAEAQAEARAALALAASGQKRNKGNNRNNLTKSNKKRIEAQIQRGIREVEDQIEDAQNRISELEITKEKLRNNDNSNEMMDDTNRKAIIKQIMKEKEACQKQIKIFEKILRKKVKELKELYKHENNSNNENENGSNNSNNNNGNGSSNVNMIGINAITNRMKGVSMNRNTRKRPKHSSNVSF